MKNVNRLKFVYNIFIYIEIKVFDLFLIDIE